jgi:hypothetical protein
MYLADEVDARTSRVQPPALFRSVVSLGADAVSLEGVSEDVVGSELGVVDTVGGVSEVGSVVSLATPLTSLE